MKFLCFSLTEESGTSVPALSRISFQGLVLLTLKLIQMHLELLVLPLSFLPRGAPDVVKYQQ
jgi:hypothetical protein